MQCGPDPSNLKCEKEMSVRSGLKYVGWNPKNPVEKTLEFFKYDAEYADDPDTTSLNSTLYLEEGNTDDHFFVTDPRGFDIFLQEMKKALPPGVLKLKKNVTSVDWTGSDKVIVHTEDGSKYTAEYVLCTFSIGVLANNMVRFEPKLPDWKLTEIYKFRMTWFTKIFIKFPSAFWAENEWILYADNRRGYYPVFGNLNAAIPNTLLLIVVGEESRRIEGQNDTKTKDEIMTILRKIYNEDIEDPEAIYVTKWGMDPLQYGSFSNWPPEVSEECYRYLQAPVGRLYFAGEATHEKYNGYLQGAYLTGQEQAKLIHQALGDSQKLDSSYWFVFPLVAIHVSKIL
ncbi:uncharacterized protein [Ptychodera flava]|uniref:uncharacterized protein n=1 Tax=Ptychodera flava TaxID=63121 RepID=UPI00396A32C6